MEGNFNQGQENLSYEHFFQHHYESVRKQAFYVAAYDYELSEDILHDLYLRLQQRRFSTKDIRNIHAYLQVSLRNAYISHRRKEMPEQIPLLEHASADIALLAVDPRRLIEVFDELRAVCQYSCIRKESSISASILILRFFHGYFTDEVARVAKRSRNAVEVRLLAARREVDAYLQNPQKFMIDSRLEAAANPSARPQKETYYDLLSELRGKIFSTRSGNCLSEGDLQSIYISGESGIDRKALNHLVSCEDCLDRANRMLNIPPLSERHPLDTLGRNIEARPEKIEQVKVARAAA